jgi:catechol 2,3-dioxygenase-like lactoylglutathione lyase family enzyme
MPRRFDHIDLRVRRLSEVRRFYDTLLPALGFTREAGIQGWLTYEVESNGVSEFFGVTESAQHVTNESRIAFWAESTEEVNRLATVAIQAGARNVEGPMVYEDENYYAVFFEDPSGNRLEICHRADR